MQNKNDFINRLNKSTSYPYVLAEIGANHNGDMNLAYKLIDAAKASGADGVKFQSWDNRIFSKEVYEKNYFLGDDYRERKDHSLHSIVAEYSLNCDQFRDLCDYCKKVSIDFSSTPFEIDQVEVLDRLEVPFIKIASMDIDNFELLDAAASTGRPVILSTGFSELEEVVEAVEFIKSYKGVSIALLHCISLYPPEDKEVNLRNMMLFANEFECPIGFSDHTMGSEASLAAVALGASFIEKHFTLDKRMNGWDHAISADAMELTNICVGTKRVFDMLGQETRILSDNLRKRAGSYRRSIVAARDIKKGEVLSSSMITYKRPGTGIPPSQARQVIGMRSLCFIHQDQLIQSDMLGQEL